MSRQEQSTRVVWPVLALCALILPAACGDDGGDTPGGADAGIGTLTYKPCAIDKKVGGIEATLAAAFTGVQGQVYDGVVPGNIPTEVSKTAECRLYSARSLFCTPACTPGQTCGEAGTCIPYPKTHSVGAVTLTGLKTPLTMNPSGSIFYYTNSSPLPHPGFDAGAALVLKTGGGDYQPVTLLGQGIEQLAAASGSAKVLVESGEAVTVTWKAPAKAGAARIHIELNINQHGGTGGWITCDDVPDTGSYTIPAAMVTALYKMGLSGFPGLTVTRRTADSATITPGCMQFTVVSSMELDLAVSGVTSCTKDSECPTGQTCQADLTCK